MQKKVATQISPRTLAARANGAKGGIARAANHTKTEIQSWGSKGGTATLQRHGKDFFSHAVSKRKTVGRYRTPVAK